jgi:heme-degrading monooxygenase HmoA
MFVALSKFVVANGMTEQVKHAFAQRPHLVDSAPGFVRLDVISPTDNLDEIWLITYWEDEASYRTWHHGHTYHASHRQLPKGLKLVPKSAQIRFFEYVSS